MMAAQRMAEAIQAGVPPTTESQPNLPVSESQPSLPVIEEGTAENRSAKAKLVVQADQEAEQRAEKCPAEVEASSEDNRTDKRPCLEESDAIVPSTVGRIAEMGRRHHDAIEQLGRLQTEVEGQRSRAEFEALRAKMEVARAEAEVERARNADELRLAAEKRAEASAEALKLAREAVSKLEAELEEAKKAKEAADSEASKGLYTAYEVDMRLRVARREIEKKDERIRSLGSRAEKAKRELKEHRKAKAAELCAAGQSNPIVKERVTQQLLSHAIADRDTASMFAVENVRTMGYEQGFHAGRKVGIDKTKEKLAEEVCRYENEGFRHGWIVALQDAEDL
ncbi:uncharacterized protein LOC114274583 [Camellia sinensis]|uniref:uncharacterized protein LOC114274583 n=1 Tax=Camellia sinensis TaxID=4442 RepID=UPI0010360ABB|nr:uncharacterized protein LOC114274583 [Camellia sinensis]